jgi:heat-inducible transcriptional repressor
MKKIQERQIQILKHIIEGYIRTGDITGSKSLLSRHNLQVSSATVRNDMMSLEKMGLLFQPYNSAGRLPTTRGLRVFVDYLMNTAPATYLEEVPVSEKYDSKRIDDTLYEIVKRLTRATSEITFAYLPELGAYYYLGLSGYLERSQGSAMADMTHIVSLLEDKK